MPGVSSPYGPLTVIVNPHAGRRRVAEEIPELERTLQARGLPYTLLRTEGRGDATRFAREAIEGGARFIVAVGGDGTVHEVVNGMMGEEGPLAPDAVLGVVAAGSGCDFIRTFGLPGDATRACYHLTGDNVYPLDVGRIRYTTVSGGADVRHFVNVAEAGLGAAVAARAERMSPRFGQAKYFVAFWRTLPTFRLATVRVVVDERRTYEGPAYLVVVGNAQYYGGGMRISPRSYPGDGVLDVLVFKGPKTDSFTLLPKIYRGEHLPHDHVEELRARRIVRIEADRPLPIEADGEVLGATPAEIEVIPHAIRMKL